MQPPLSFVNFWLAVQVVGVALCNLHKRDTLFPHCPVLLEPRGEYPACLNARNAKNPVLMPGECGWMPALRHRVCLSERHFISGPFWTSSRRVGEQAGPLLRAAAVNHSSSARQNLLWKPSSPKRPLRLRDICP